MHGVGRWTGLVPLGALLTLLAIHVVGVGLDFVAAIRYPFELGYAEGIIWQQAALIPGPRMYSSSQELPFIVFHYPPLYHLLARAALSLQPDFLAAGRLVSALSTRADRARGRGARAGRDPASRPAHRRDRGRLRDGGRHAGAVPAHRAQLRRR